MIRRNEIRIAQIAPRRICCEKLAETFRIARLTGQVALERAGQARLLGVRQRLRLDLELSEAARHLLAQALDDGVGEPELDASRRTSATSVGCVVATVSVRRRGSRSRD